MSEFRRARLRSEVAGEEPHATFNTADGTWNQRAGVEERIRETMELSIPNEAIRRAALHFLALAIDNADEERGNAWCVRETERGLRVMTGRLLACEVVRSKMRVSVIGPIGDDVRGTLGAEAENDEEFKFKMVPGGLLLTFPIEHAVEAFDLLRDGFNGFVDMAMARVRRPVSASKIMSPRRLSTSPASSAASCRSQSRSPTPRDPNSSMMPRTRTISALRGSHGFAGGRRSSSTVSAPLLR
jgi:hypothetical protein